MEYTPFMGIHLLYNTLEHTYSLTHITTLCRDTRAFSFLFSNAFYFSRSLLFSHLFTNFVAKCTTTYTDIKQLLNNETGEKHSEQVNHIQQRNLY